MKYRQFFARILSIAVRVSLVALPLVRATKAEAVEKLPLVWPPLGGFETYAAVPAAAIIGAFGVIPAMLMTKKRARFQGYLTLACALICLFVYSFFFITLVQGVAIPGDGTRYFTIGTVRTAAAMREFPHATNEQLIEAAGVRGEGDLERAWTATSLKLAELELLVSYVCLMASVNYAVGAFARATKGAKEATPLDTE